MDSQSKVEIQSSAGGHTSVNTVSFGNAAEMKYEVYRIIRHLETPHGSQFQVSWYEYKAKDVTVELADKLSTNFVKRYSERLRGKNGSNLARTIPNISQNNFWIMAQAYKRKLNIQKFLKKGRGEGTSGG